MKSMRIILGAVCVILLGIGTSISLTAQNCEAYVRLVDVSGFETDPYQSGLVTATCDFLQSFPDLQDSFKVFDLGFYLHQEHYQGGFPDAFQQKIDEVANQSPYYLVFGKQTDQSGIYTKFWIDLKLPESGQFQCLDLVASDFRDNLKSRILNHTNNVYEIQGGKPENYAEAEVQALAELKRQLDLLSDCCDPGFNPKSGEVCYNCPSTGYDILKEMIDTGLVLEPIYIIQDNSPGGGTSTANDNSALQKNLTTLDMTVSFSGEAETWDLDNFFDVKLVNAHVQYYQNRFGVTPSVGKHYYKYPQDCDFASKYRSFLEDGSDLKFFVGIVNIDGRIGIMGYEIGAKTSYRDQVKDDVIVAAIQHELDEILKLGASPKTISQLTIQHLNASNPNDFELLLEVEDNFVAANYQLAMTSYREKKSSYNSAMLDRYQQLWRDEHNYYLAEYDGGASRGQALMSAFKASWNMGSYAIHGSELVEVYARMKKEIVLELLLGFQCARDRGETSFPYLQAGRILPFSIFRKAHLAHLLQGIKIRKIEFQQPDNTYSINTGVPLITGSTPNYLKKEGTQNGWNYTVTILGSESGEDANFVCVITTRTLEQAQNLAYLFNNGLSVDSEELYATDGLALSLAAGEIGQNCITSWAKRILASAPLCSIDYLNNEERIKLINCLVNGGWTSSVDKTEEVLVLKLLESIKKPCDFIGLAENGTNGLDAKNLLKAIDYPVLSQVLIERLNLIYGDCYNNNPVEEEDPANYEAIFILKDALEGLRFDETKASITSNNKVNIRLESLSFTDVALASQYGWQVPSSSDPNNLDLFDRVSLVIEVGKIENVGITTDTVVQWTGVPAIVAAFIIQNYTKQQLIENTTTILNLYLFGMSGVQLIPAAKLLSNAQVITREILFKFGLGLLDFGASFTDTYCSVDPNAPLCNEWRQYGIYVAAGTLTLNAYELHKYGTSLAYRMRLIDQEYKDFPAVRRWLARLDNQKFSEDLHDFMAGLSNTTKSTLNDVLGNQANSQLFNFFKLNPDAVRGWDVISHLPNEISLSQNNIKTLTDYLLKFKVVKAELPVPIRIEYTQGWINEVEKILQPEIVPYPGSGPGTNIPFLVEYANRVVEIPYFSDGAAKLAYKLPDEPDRLIVRLRHDIDVGIEDDRFNPLLFDRILKEFQDLDKLRHIYNIPTIETYGVTNHRGLAAMVMKYYDQGSMKGLGNGSGYNTQVIPSELVSNNSLVELVNIKEKILSQDLYIQDLQFLVENNKFYVHDPQEVVVDAIRADDEILNSIDPLIDELIVRQLKDTGLTQTTLSYIKNDLLENIIDEDYLRDFIEFSKPIPTAPPLITIDAQDNVYFHW